jgi:hypothetical protein
MAKKPSAAQRARRAERRASQPATPSTAANAGQATQAEPAASDPETAAPNAHSTEARAARTRTRRSADHRKKRLRRGAIGLGVGFPLAIVLAFSAGIFQPHLGVEASDEGGVGLHVGQGRQLSQSNRPPSSGPHYGSSARYGVSAQPIPAGNWIHNLEHGGIVILFRCTDATECDQLASRVRTEVTSVAEPGAFGSVKIVGVPYQDMDTPFTAVAWRRTLPLETFDAEQVLAFYDRYRDRGPESAP